MLDNINENKINDICMFDLADSENFFSASDKFIRFSTSYKETTKQQQQKIAENQETST